MHKQKICPWFLALLFMLFALPFAAQQAAGQDKVKEETPAECVERNLAAAQARLAKARANYQKCCALADFSASSLDPEAIAGALPKPHRLKFIIDRPEEKIVDITSAEANWQASYRYFPEAIYGSSNYGNMAAADDLTASLLNLRRTLPLNFTATFSELMEPQTNTTCCLTFNIKTTSDGSYNGATCSRYATQTSLSYVTGRDPRTLPTRLGFHLALSSGGELLGNGAAVRFDKPGLAAVTGTLQSSYTGADFKAENVQTCQAFDYTTERLPGNGPIYYRLKVTYKDALNAYSVGVHKVTGNWQPPPNRGQQKQEIKVDVIEFTGVRMDGRNYQDSGKLADGYDLFAKDGAPFKEIKLYENEPELLLRRAPRKEGVAIDEKADVFVEKAANWQVPINYYVLEGGPFTVTQRGMVQPLGGVGAAKLRLNVGDRWYLDRPLTANRWTAELDPAMADGKVAPGGSYPVAIRVQGPADMAKYSVQWTGSQWQNTTAAFVRQGNAWVAENVITIPESAKPGSSVNLAMKAFLGTKEEGVTRLEWQPSFPVVPSVTGLELELAAKGQPLGKGTVDLFFPNHLPDGNRFIAAPVFKGAGGEQQAPGAVYRLISDSPAVAWFWGGQYGQVGNAVGEAWISAETGSDMNPQGALKTPRGAKLISNTVKVTANQLLLTQGKDQGGFTSYAIRVVGPARMEGYQSRWYYGGQTSTVTFYQAEDGGQISGLSKTQPLPITKVEILKGGALVAMLPVNDDNALPQAGIRLLPIKLPGTVVDRIDPVDFGSLTSKSDCRKQLRAKYPGYYGSASDDTLNAVCATMRDDEKEDLKKQREIQKDQKQILVGLKKAGRQLMVFSDTTELGASISGVFDPQRMHCRWRIDTGGSLKIQQTETQILRVAGDGACFATLSGFQGDFDTAAMATVELIYAQPAAAAGQFAGGGSASVGGYAERAKIEEWVSK